MEIFVTAAVQETIFKKIFVLITHFQSFSWIPVINEEEKWLSEPEKRAESA